MVNKTSVQEPQKATQKPAAKKVSTKAATSKKAAVKTEAKKVEEKVLNKQVPVKENVNPVEQVLEIKAHNEEKKAAKTASKTTRQKVVAKTVSGEEKGNSKKADVKRAKVIAVKNSAQKAAAVRKLAEMKEDLSVQPKCCCKLFTKDGAWAAWANAFKNIFNYKGRVSRYEFWSFMLINFFFTIIIGYGGFVALTGFVSPLVSLLYLFLFLVTVILTALSLSVRRIHDTGHSAWNGFYRQLFFAILGFIASVVLAGCVYAGFAEGSMRPNLMITSAAICLLLIVSFMLIASYYSTKIAILTSYYESEAKDNEYGKLSYGDDCYKVLSLRYAAIFCVAVSSLYFIIGFISGYMKAMGYSY